MLDPDTRRAARLAALIAVPAALLAGLASLWAFGAFDAAQPASQPSSAAPRARATGPVTITAPALSAEMATACRALVAALPGALHDAARRPVTAATGQTAAYGDPAIILSCGTPPASYAPTDDVYTLDSVCWHAGPAQAGAITWTTVDRTVPVTVVVPVAYEGQAQWVIEFSRAVRDTLAPSTAKPSGCA